MIFANVKMIQTSESIGHVEFLVFPRIGEKIIVTLKEKNVTLKVYDVVHENNSFNFVPTLIVGKIKL